jgi:hypothetical protein
MLRDVSATGAFVPLGDDQLSAPLPIGFSFEFYGISYSDFRISSNGFITLGPNLESQGCCTGQAIPQPFSPNNFVAGFWEDLNAPQGNIRFQTLGSPGGRQLVVGFYGVPHFFFGPPVTWEVVLHEASNNIEIHCVDCPSDGGLHTIGIEDPTGTIGLEVLQTSQSVPPSGWLITLNAPPDCSTASPDPDSLWPPEHQFADVAVVGVSDPDGDPVEIVVTAISQDEPVIALGDGLTIPDASGLGSDAATLRAERSSLGDGRVYHVDFLADDGRGGQCEGTVTVCVPHDEAEGLPGVCVDQGPLFDSTFTGSGSTEPIVIGPVNGGFETGDFTGWGQFNSGSGGIAIDDGTFDPPGDGGPVPPFEGSFASATFQSGPGVHTLYTDVALDPELASATLEWADNLQNHAGVFSDPNQEWRVEVRDPSDNSVLAELFSTNPGDPPIQDWTLRSADLSPWIGQTIRLAFTEQDSLWFFNARLDAVRILGERLLVDVDIRPGPERNVINLQSEAVVPVAILGSDTFDVTEIDPTTLAFGPAAATPTAPRAGIRRDVNGDGFDDLVSKYRGSEAGLAFGDAEACVTGETVDGTAFSGCDFVVILPLCGLGFEVALLLPLLSWLRRRRQSVS